jgi:hypothetical protein
MYWLHNRVLQKACSGCAVWGGGRKTLTQLSMKLLRKCCYIGSAVCLLQWLQNACEDVPCQQHSWPNKCWNSLAQCLLRMCVPQALTCVGVGGKGGVAQP